ncbi:MAG: polyprenyl synthetase family protein [Candidatus Nanopelagicales bacterium]|jgi:heptaprenyl diphosphate synthase
MSTHPPGPLVGLGVVDPLLEGRLVSGMERVESLLRDSVRSDYPFVTEASRHLVDAGGKRFRPLLVLLAAQFGDPDAPGVVPAGVVVELTHLATLYHDDVMDEADLRRGAASANARWDNTVAILTGDFLFAKASDILADLGPEAVRIQARTFERLCTGQIRETIGPESGDAVEHHLRVLSDKTGSLIATSGRFGAMMSGADASIVETMTLFGEQIGVAFQLADDIVDIASDFDESGKIPGTDLREGVPTLTGLIALATDDDPRLQDLLTRPLDDDADHTEALKRLREHPALDAARLEAKAWADRARDTLSDLPDGSPREALTALCDYVVTRSG